MNLFTIFWLLLLLAGIVAVVLLKVYCQRSTILAIYGTAIVFLSMPLAKFFAFSGTYSASPQVIESWLFSFRFLGIALFIWGMCDGLNQKIESLKSKL